MSLDSKRKNETMRYKNKKNFKSKIFTVLVLPNASLTALNCHRPKETCRLRFQTLIAELYRHFLEKYYALLEDLHCL